jgi:lipopolysaccharide export system permease protein
MKTIEGYLAREIYRTTAFVALAFVALFAFFDFINELGDLGKGTYSLPQAFLFVLLSVPGHLYELFPIAVLVGTLIALSVMASNSEYTVLRVSGLSPGRAGWLLVRIGVWFVVLTIVVGEFVAPAAEERAQRLRLDRLGATVSQELRTGLWVRADSRFVNIRQVLPDSTLRGVQIYEFDPAMRLVSISEAQTGVFDPQENLWALSDVRRTLFDGEGTAIDEIKSLTWKTVLNPDMLAILLVRPDKMSAVGLFQYAKHLEKNHQNTDRYEIALWKKLVYPFAAWVMMALALPFAYLLVRSGGVGVKLFAGIMLGVLFHFLNALFSHLGVLEAWPPAASAILPSALFFGTAVVMMWWVERR